MIWQIPQFSAKWPFCNHKSATPSLTCSLAYLKMISLSAKNCWWFIFLIIYVWQVGWSFWFNHPLTPSPSPIIDRFHFFSAQTLISPKHTEKEHYFFARNQFICHSLRSKGVSFLFAVYNCHHATSRPFNNHWQENRSPSWFKLVSNSHTSYASIKINFLKLNSMLQNRLRLHYKLKSACSQAHSP